MTLLPDARKSPLFDKLRSKRSTLWINPEAYGPAPTAVPIGIDVQDAERRMERAAPLIRTLFPELAGVQDPVCSPLSSADRLAESVGALPEHGRWLIKEDHRLPIAGSIKARGGFHEVIAVAERLAVLHGLIEPDGDLTALASPSARAHFAQCSIVVGSTGNLGLAIGLLSSALGFSSVVHMSREAKEWKKQRLRDAGARVVEHGGDYLNAVAQGRAEADGDGRSHFVDDEHSTDLFNGYAVAAGELAAQLEERHIVVDQDHPLFVYIPCGVGGAPGGITFGLKRLFGDSVHCFFAEPAAAPCMLLQISSGLDESISIAALGLDGRTEADGLAVGRASMLVAPMMRSRMSGAYTLDDDQLFVLLRHAFEDGGLDVEPSAAAGIAGPLALMRSAEGQRFLRQRELEERLPQATHVIWSTGGATVPATERELYRARAHTASSDLAF